MPLTCYFSGGVELRGLEPLTPCLQIAGIVQVTGAHLGSRFSASDRGIPLVTGVNEAR
jgi:hypothetical protein